MCALVGRGAPGTPLCSRDLRTLFGTGVPDRHQSAKTAAAAKKAEKQRRIRKPRGHGRYAAKRAKGGQL
jgi:hypothetical protein